MIRNVVLGRLQPAQDAAADRDRKQLEAALAGIAGLKLPGMVANHVGLDAGVRDGGWSFAITNDFEDVEAYQVYDADPEHVGYRTRLGEVCEAVARVQFEL